MTTTTIDSPLNSVRKPRVALNLTLLSPGLGHIYCGVITKGLSIMSMSLFGVLLFIVGLISPAPWSAPLIWIAVALLVGLIVFAAIDARRIARATRPDYRLKDYNRPLIYVLLFLVSGAFAPVLAIVAREWVVEAFIIPGDSCYPTYESGDRVLANKRAYVESDPERGDTIVFKSPRDRSKTWVKRVIGIPGDTIEIRDGQVIVNGDSLQAFEQKESTAPGGQKGIEQQESIDGQTYEVFQPTTTKTNGPVMQPLITVPTNHLFVLGDNRANSLDSRHFGPISIFSVTGKVTTRYWPLF